MIRSSEFKRSHGMTEHIGKPEAPSLHHMRVMPHEGGVMVTHHASPRAEAHATHHFGHGEEEAFMGHMSEHAGLAGAGGEAEADGNRAEGGLEAE